MRTTTSPASTRGTGRSATANLRGCSRIATFIAPRPIDRPMIQPLIRSRAFLTSIEPRRINNRLSSKQPGRPPTCCCIDCQPCSFACKELKLMPRRHNGRGHIDASWETLRGCGRPLTRPARCSQKSTSVTSPCAGVIELLTINGRFSMEEMFIQTDEQRAILETVRRFVAEVVTPKAPALDAMTDPAAGYSEEIVTAADAVGIRTMTLSEKYGGLGTDSITTAMVVEELAIGDLGTSVVMAQTLKLAHIMEQALNADCLLY